LCFVLVRQTIPNRLVVSEANLNQTFPNETYVKISLATDSSVFTYSWNEFFYRDGDVVSSETEGIGDGGVYVSFSLLIGHKV
jgi:hypothetical protein